MRPDAHALGGAPGLAELAARGGASRAVRTGWRPSGTIAVLLTIAVAAAIVVLAPLVSLVATGLSGGTSTLAALSRSVLPAALIETALLLTGVALVAGSIGAVTAWTVTEFKFPGSNLMAWLLPLPLALPTYVAAYIYVELLDAAGPVQGALRALGGWRARSDYAFPEIRSLPGCILVMSLVLYPYVYVAMRAAFLARGPAAIDAARTLGAGTARVFVSVALPLARPALVAGVTLVLLETMNDIGATEYLGVRTLTVSAYTAWLNRGDLPGAAQIALVALAVVAALVVAERGSRGRAGRAPESSETRFATRIALSGWPALVAATVCALPILFGLVLPMAFLVLEAVRRDLLGTVDAVFVRHLAETIGLGIAATLAVIGLAVPVVLAGRLVPGRLTRAAALTAGLGYALPGTILVLGLLAPLVAVDGLASRMMSALVGSAPSLLLTGSLGGLVVAYTIRFLRVGADPLAASVVGRGGDLEGAARVLGARPASLVRHVHLPLMRPALGAAALLVFVDCVKELPATVLLRPLNTETMATLVYGAASRGAFEEGALAALFIVAVGLGPVIWLNGRMSRPARPVQPRLPLRARFNRRQAATRSLTASL